MEEYTAGVIAARIGFSGGSIGGGSGSNEGVGEGDRDDAEDDEGELGEEGAASVLVRGGKPLSASMASEVCHRVLRAPTQASRRSR